MSDDVKTIYIADPWYEFAVHGKKTVDGRLNGGYFSRLKEGDKILIVRSSTKDDPKPTTVSGHITKITPFKSFHELLDHYKVEKVLPGMGTVEKGVQFYRQFYDEGKESEHGVVGIEFKLNHHKGAAGGKARAKSRTRSKSRAKVPVKAKSKSRKRSKSRAKKA